MLSASDLAGASTWISPDFVGPVAPFAFAPSVDDTEIVGLATASNNPAVASDAAGNYVVTWIGTVPGDASEVFDVKGKSILAQRHNASGEPIGDVIVVQDGVWRVELVSDVRVAMLADGQFIVAWNANYSALVGSRGPLFGVQARRFDAAGEPIGDAFSISDDKIRLQDLATNAAGEMAIAYFATYTNFLGPYRDPELLVQRFDAAGNSQGAPINLGLGSGASVAMADDGHFVVAWRDFSPHSLGLVAQMFNADSSPRGDRFRVSWLPGNANSPSIGMDADGAFVIAWDQESNGQHRVFAERRDATAKALGPAFEVSQQAEIRAPEPNVEMHHDGNFYVTWDPRYPYGGDPGPVGVRARAYDAGGRAIGTSFPVGTIDASLGIGGSAVGSSGALIVAWLDDPFPKGPSTQFAPLESGPYLDLIIASHGRTVHAQQFTVARAATLDLNGPDAGIDHAVNFQIGGAAVPIGPEVAIRHWNVTLGTFVRVEIEGWQDGDVLAYDVAGTNISALYSAGALVLLGNDSIAHYEQVLSSVTFVASADRVVGSNVEVSFTIDDGEADSVTATSTISIYQPGLSSIVGRHIFYNNSAFDARDPAATAGDDGAIATDKTALLPGGTSSFGNMTSYTRGINGIIIDVAGSHGQITAADFEFHLGLRDQPGWSFAPPPESVTVRPGAGAGGSDRVEIIWADGVIKNAWLQVVVLANGNTGLAELDAFWFGNVVGETGDSQLGLASLGDAMRSINHVLGQPEPNEPAAIDNPYDFNRDGVVKLQDVMVVINQVLSDRPRVEMISPPGSAAASSNYYGLFVEMHIPNIEQIGQVSYLSVGTLTEAPSAATAVDAAITLWEYEEPESLAGDPAELLLPTETRP